MAKIAILSFYSGVVERGVETFAYEISRRLSTKHEVTIIQAGKIINKDEKVRRQIHAVKTVKIPAFASIPKSSKGIIGKFYLDWQSAKILIFSLRSIPLLIKNKYHVLVLLNGGWQVSILRLVSKFTKSRIIIPGEAGIGSDDAANLFFRPDVFVALTNAQAKWASRLAPEVKVEIIPNGVDLSKFNPKVKMAKVALEGPIVVCTSALVPYKRVELTIKAVAETKKLSLLLIGDGEMRPLIDTLGKRLLGKRYLRTKIPYEKIASYYRAGKVFTLASKTEAFGSSYIEAMACNLPVVTTSDESRLEIIGRAGILTDPTNVSKYAKDLLIAASTNYRNIPYDQAARFSWNKVADKYLALINEFS